VVVEGESAAGRSLRCVESRATSCPTLTRRMPQPCRLPSIISPTYVSLPSCCTCQRLRLPLLVGGEDRAEAGWPMRLPPTAGSSSYAQNLWRKADRELTPKRSNMAAHIGGRLGGSHFRTAHAHDGARAFAHRRPPARPRARLPASPCRSALRASGSLSCDPLNVNSASTASCWASCRVMVHSPLPLALQLNMWGHNPSV
jgi:hypothetical protein